MAEYVHSETDYYNLDQEDDCPDPIHREYDEISSDEEDTSTQHVASVPHADSSLSSKPPLPERPRKGTATSTQGEGHPFQPGHSQFQSSRKSSASESQRPYSHGSSFSHDAAPPRQGYYNVYPEPNMMRIPWFHPNLSRNAAEALLHTAGRDGSYLLRTATSGQNAWSVSVRCQNAVKHFQVLFDGKHFKFGLAQFNSLDEFIRHFDNQPLMSGESGVAVMLRFPYPRNVEEPNIYEMATVHTEMGSAVPTDGTPVLGIASKEGYLTKMGFFRKSWSKRWFVVFKNEVRYYKKRGDKQPIRVIDLKDATEVSEEKIPGRWFCFKLVTAKRTFCMEASSDTELQQWMYILNWKLSQLKSHD